MIDAIRTLQDLRDYVHAILCRQENLVEEQFLLQEYALLRKGEACGLQFLLNGPRQVKLAAVWSQDRNQLYFYDARGERFRKESLPHSVTWDR